MYKKQKPQTRGEAVHVLDVRFMEVEFDAPTGTRMVIELSGGVRLLVADDSAVDLAADFVNFLRRADQGGRRK